MMHRRPQPSRLRQRCAAIALALATAGLAACSSLGDKAEPPPYPAVEKGETGASLRWKNTRGGDALPGFQPVATSQGLWVADERGHIRLLDLKDGRERKSFRIDTRTMAGLAADESLVVLADRNGSIRALDHDGRQRWSTPLNAEMATAPQLADTVVLVRTIDGRVMALEHDTGSVRWSWKAPASTSSARATTSRAPSTAPSASRPSPASFATSSATRSCRSRPCRRCSTPSAGSTASAARS